MVDGHIPPEKLQDPQGLRISIEGVDMSRDPERTPMQWDDSPNAGFAAEGVETWLPVADNYQTLNVVAQENDPASHLNTFRAIVKLRRELPALHDRGVFTFIDGLPDSILAYTREKDNVRIAVVINFSETTHTLDLSAQASSGELLLTTRMDKAAGKLDLNMVELRPTEGLILKPDS